MFTIGRSFGGIDVDVRLVQSSLHINMYINKHRYAIGFILSHLHSIHTVCFCRRVLSAYSFHNAVYHQENALPRRTNVEEQNVVASYGLQK